MSETDVYDLNAQDGALARAWIAHVSQNTCYTVARIMEGERGGIPGLFVCVSTAASANQAKDNAANKVILVPEYFLYDVWFHERVSMYNFYGIGWGGVRIGTLEEVLHDMSMNAGMPDWRLVFAPKVGEYHNQQLHRLLVRLGIQFHILITTGLSYYRYRAIDVYTRGIVGDAAVPDYEAHDVVYASVDPYQRPIPRAADWWMYYLREHIGQRSIVAEWYLERGSQVDAMQTLCQSYLEPGMQMQTLKTLFTQCQRDYNGLYRVLKCMQNIIDPARLPGHAEYMHQRITQIRSTHVGESCWGV